MTGYIIPLVGELKVCDYEYYKSAYCGLCRRMGQICGSGCRITLSYDMVFLYLVRLMMSGEVPDCVKRHCPANPAMRKKVPENSKELDYVSAVSGILAAYKFRDGIADEKGLRRLGSRAGSGISKRWRRRARGKYPGLEEGISERLRRFYAAEEKCRADSDAASADILAGLFGDVLAYVFSYGYGEDSHLKPVAEAIGRHTGRWLYCTDALDDIADDSKKHRFNPYLLLYGREKLTDDEKTTVDCLLGAEAGAAYDALDLSPVCDGTEACRRIVVNILTKGMPSVVGKVLQGTFRRTPREKI